MVDENLDVCPNCGAPITGVKRTVDVTPKTIEELLLWANNHNLPLKDMRFFIGENYNKPRAFGIYKNSHNEFVVYKNKANGERSIRYQGVDEAYAVNELYMKMKSEIINQKQNNPNLRSTSFRTVQATTATKSTKSIGRTLFGIIYSSLFIAVLIVCIAVPVMKFINNGSKNGYYVYDDNIYYKLGNLWYVSYLTSDGNYDWESTDDLPYSLLNNLDDYYSSKDYSSQYGCSNFRYSSEYQNYVESNWSDNDSWDSDSDYDWSSSDSWDSSYTDWDSDW
jgi:hypothetical protein